jgi:hypothetical protein
MNSLSRHIWLVAIFVLLITGLSLAYHYPETLLKRPQSIHNWRQCDGASIALNYYQEGMHFFKPQTHMLYSDDNTTGYSAPSELPILYYFVAILYKIFGYHEYLFRGLNLLIFFTGLFYLFKLSDAILHNLLFSTITVALIFSSPVLVYYANNFMPNTVAMSFSCIGWYYFYKYYCVGKSRVFMVSMFFFALAGTMKITELTSVFIILILLLADRFRLINLGLNTDGRFWKKIGAIIFISALVFAWIFYAKYYNRLHSSVQFMTYTLPIWEMDSSSIDLNLHKMKVLWFKDYFYPVTLWFLVACLIITAIFRKRSNKILFYSSFLLTGALIAFSILWFQVLGDHDYFYIGFYILPAFLLINFFFILDSFHFPKIAWYAISTFFLMFSVLNVVYAHERHTLRYAGSWMNDYPQMEDMYTINPWLKEMDINREDTIIFYPSIYIRPLYLMNMKGWVMRQRDVDDSGIEQTDSISLQTYLHNGAGYFVINDLKLAADYKPFWPYMKDLYGKYNSMYFFRIPPLELNFNPADTIMLNSLIK